MFCFSSKCLSLLQGGKDCFFHDGQSICPLICLQPADIFADSVIPYRLLEYFIFPDPPDASFYRGLSSSASCRAEDMYIGVVDLNIPLQNNAITLLDCIVTKGWNPTLQHTSVRCESSRPISVNDLLHIWREIKRIVNF